jgi:hypothetical protein
MSRAMVKCILACIKSFGRSNPGAAAHRPPLTPLLHRVVSSPALRYDDNYDVARALLKHAGMTPAEINAPVGPARSTPLHGAASATTFEVVWLLVEKGARPSLRIKDAQGRTPARVAAQHEHISMSDFLLEEQGLVDGDGGGEEGDEGEEDDGDGHAHG